MAIRTTTPPARPPRSRPPVEPAQSVERKLNEKGIPVEQSVTIHRMADELYRFWRNFQNLPRFRVHLESVTEDGRISRWVARGPAGQSVTWDAEIVDDQPGRLIAWRSLPGSDVDNMGQVRFEPAPRGRGAVVRVHVQYSPPGGRLGAAVAKLYGEEPNQQVREDLRRFKQLIETGEIPTTEGQPRGGGKHKERRA